MDTVVRIITNAHPTTEKGYGALADFDARVASIPAFDSGYRLIIRGYPGGYVKRAINSGADRFYIICKFIAAIGLDSTIIPDGDLRAEVNSAVEAACVLAHLLKAEVLTPKGPTATYAAVRRYLTKMRMKPFKKQQQSHWAVIKFHLLMHIQNWLHRGAPAFTGSSKIEAALRILVTRVLKRASNIVQRDIASGIIRRAVTAMIERHRLSQTAAPSGAAASATLPARRVLLERTRVTPSACMVASDKQPSNASLLRKAVRVDWVNAFPLSTAAAAAAVAQRVEWCSSIRISRPQERFDAPLSSFDVIELDPTNPRFALDAAAAEAARDDPARAKLARIHAVFHVPPATDGGPAAGVAADGLLVPRSVSVALAHVCRDSPVRRADPERQGHHDTRHSEVPRNSTPSRACEPTFSLSSHDLSS